MACPGELLRAHDALTHVQRHLLWVARLVADRTEHWLTPDLFAERELTPDLLAELRRVAAAGGDVHATIHRAWQCGRRFWLELMDATAARSAGTVRGA